MATELSAVPGHTLKTREAVGVAVKAAGGGWGQWREVMVQSYKIEATQGDPLFREEGIERVSAGESQAGSFYQAKPSRTAVYL